MAADQRISSESSGTGAHGPVRARPVEPGLTIGAGTARIRVAKVPLLKLAAADEWVAGVALGTGADSLVVGGLARGALAAHVRVGLVAGITAFKLHARLVTRAIGVTCTLGIASRWSL